tara:strand:- start:197 stop:868 length:672 start_codon:yes stop_codon:yes gene_type:complete
MSIIIPVYNEEKHISHLINKILKVINKLKYKFEIIVVNDGSTDNTKIELQNFKDKIILLNKENGGKGSAVKYGVKMSKGNFILIQDGDLEYNPEDYEKMIMKISKNKVVIGSRTLENNKRLSKQSYGPWLFNKLLSNIYFYIFKIKITDSLSGYKIYPKEFIKNAFIKTSGFETDHELICKAIKNNYELEEVAIQYKPRTKSEGKKINAIDGLKAIYTILRFK